VPALLAAIAMIAALIYREDLIAWFTGARSATAAQPAASSAGSAGTGSAGEVAYYTCAMHPQVHLDHPGHCPICSMPLVAVLRADQAAGLIRVDPARRDALGIRTTAAVRAPLALTIRAAGRVVVDETRLHDVTLKVSGYVSQLQLNATGQRVAKGDPLFALYSPELYAAEQDYLIARRSRDATHGDALIQAAETRLRLWGLTDEQLRAIAESGQPIERVPFRSPAAGFVIEKSVVEGDAVAAGQRLFRIADLDPIWVEADLHEADLGRIARGAAAVVTLPALPGRRFDGTVAFVYPYLDPMARTGKVRVALGNPQRALKPDMFATVSFELALGDRLQIPSSAVIYTGPRRLVFVDLGDGRLRPQDVTIGARAGDTVEIVAGLAAGDRVVSAGGFLVAAESRIRSAGAFWTDTAPGAGSAGTSSAGTGSAGTGGAATGSAATGSAATGSAGTGSAGGGHAGH
jgi:Cu(I)/Ag(I) efflux system membrane fusion protein